MSELCKNPEQHFTIATNSEKPLQISRLGKPGLGRILRISPPPELLDPNYFMLAGAKNRTEVKMGPKVPEKHLILEVAVTGTSTDEIARLEQTIEDVDIILNQWHRPEEYFEMREAAMKIAQASKLARH